ncbi:MAG TPA: tetraacyldisaccharide 4'-kinase, partial [Gammaproteobacteria bacterium]|nr:tetraacyldisaccharide 4'-kinase [Gammaproteobacteria bacterium]
MSLSDQLQKHWQRVDAVGILLLPLSLVYWLVITARRWAYAVGVLKVHRFPVPVVVVGNLTVGGTGKTPFVMALTERLVGRGWQPGVVSRGYRGAFSQATLVPPDGDPRQFGDEPVLISRKTGLPVVVARKRAEGVRQLIRESVDIVVSDDGLQHRAMGRCAEIALIDEMEGFGNGFLLPAGPLREPSRR